MSRPGVLVAGLLVLASPAIARDPQFWNQTAHEFTGVRLAPSGSEHWGAEQTDNDPDHAVSADERLRITGIAPGRYDVKLTEKIGRVCVVRGVTVTDTGKVAFAIAEPQLTVCTP